MGFDMTKLLKVKNRSTGTVVYRIPDQHIRREFIPGEEKTISYEELVQLSYRPGGRSLMQNFLQIQDPEAIKQLNIHAEPEYNMSEKDVEELLNSGSVDALLDALDFAPIGVIELIKKKSVELPLYDMRKREAILKATGYDVTAAIENLKDDEEEAEPEKAAPTRRVPTPSEPTRRTESKYNVITE